MKALPDYIEFKEFPRIPFDEIFTAGTDDLIALLEALLDLNPCRRCNATQVGWFNNNKTNASEHRCVKCGFVYLTFIGWVFVSIL